MKRSYVAGAAVVVVAIVIGAWILFAGLPRWYGPQAAPEPTASEGLRPVSGRKIKATLFYVAEDGRQLVGVEREVPYEQATSDQARRILEEQVGPAPAPYVSAVPAGTTVRALFVTDRGEAYVDLSREVSTAHTGGSLDELFTVYSLVNSLGVNLPAIIGVQILIDGKEVDTLAGHVDLRHPLEKSLKWVAEKQERNSAP